jgi:VWFA-related protein
MRILAVCGALALALAVGTTGHAQLQETITVARVLVDVRVTDYHGRPIEGLAAEDFKVRIGGKLTTVESVTWVDEHGGAPLPEESDSVEALIEPREEERRRGRLVVVFVQTDWARNNFRVVGQMNFRKYANELIESLQPEDRVAVFSFDSHLKFRRDFTSDKDAVRAAIAESLFIDFPPPPPAVPNPSLARRLERDAMKRAASSERALLLVANALTPIEGPKTMLLIGWGLGRLEGGTVRMTPEWKATRRALDAARVTIFALDVAAADGHDLAFGLETAAEETGGFYASTFRFPQIAIDRLKRTMSGHYELELRVPEGLKPGPHELSIRMPRHSAVHILAPSSVVSR